jgi:hypothetical protein
VILSLVDKNGNPSPAQLYVRVTLDSVSAVAGDALEQATTFSQKLSQPLVSNASDAAINISDTLSHQQKLITSFNAVLGQFKPLVKIGDEIAKVCSPVSSAVRIRINYYHKIHPYVNFAWTVLSAGMKVSQILLLILCFTSSI